MEYWEKQEKKNHILPNLLSSPFSIIPFHTISLFPFFQLLHSFSTLPIFYHSMLILVERCLSSSHFFASVEVIQSISTIGFQPCNEARLTVHILHLIFDLLGNNFHSRNEIHHTSQEQHSNSLDTPLSSSGSNLLKYFSICYEQRQCYLPKSSSTQRETWQRLCKPGCKLKLDPSKR